ncbi:MAG: hypothetical protein ACI9F9_000141 [Candidatus Paceibacteria bacterium]|jgi:hypothetical protein
MRFHKIALTGLTAIAALGMASEAVAGGRNPGSLLLYPEFNNRMGDVSVLTVTNVDDANSVDVEFVYIGRYSQSGETVYCAEFNRTETLTPNDTLTLLTNYHNPGMEQGFVYAFAREGVANPVLHNGLIGNVMTIQGFSGVEYSINAVSYAGIDPTDDGNGLRDLDGSEYEGSPAEIQIPRFFGQGNYFMSELVLIGLSGGAKFETTVDFLIYNDNEEVFSAEHSFYCWDRIALEQVSPLVRNDFLRDNTNHDLSEVLGHSSLESGWIRMWGAIASSTSTDIADPAVYGVLIERIGTLGGADLPFETGVNLNGKLLARSNDGTF